MKELEVFKSKRVLFAAIFAGLLLIAGCGHSSSSGKKASFSATDLSGTWHTIVTGGKAYGSFNGYGYMEISESGEILSGSIINYGVDTQRFTGGALAVTAKGEITGTVDTFLPDSGTSGSHTVLDGQMTPGKDTILLAGNFTLSRNGIGILIKEEGSFTVSDLKGDWIFPMDGIFSVSIDDHGEIVSCTYTSYKDETGMCEGNFSVSAQGNVCGTIRVMPPKPFEIGFEGRMNVRKNHMIITGGITTGFAGMASLAIKADSGHSVADGKGKWKIFMAASEDTLYGAVFLSNTGDVKEGYWETFSGGNGSFTEGNLFISGHGNISGMINMSNGNVVAIQDGGINTDNNVAVFSYQDLENRQGTGVMIRLLQ